MTVTRALIMGHNFYLGQFLGNNSISHSILKENNKTLHSKTISHSVRALQMIKKVIHQFLSFSTSINFVGLK